MYFQQSYSICYESLSLPEDFGEVEIIRNDSISIYLYGAELNKIRKENHPFDPCCKILVKRDLKQQNEAILRALEKGPVKKITDSGTEFSVYLIPNKEDLKISCGSDFPESFQECICEIINELRSRAKDVVDLIKWRLGLSGSNEYFRFGEFEWSEDGKKWNKFNDFSFIFNPPVVEASILPNFTDSNKIEELFSLISKEPLYHELFREAWELRIKNPRSSIVIGMSAAEVAMKECIATLVPEAQWLAQEAPSPPLVTMMKNYLPTLPVRNNFDGKILPPPKSIRKDIEEGVKLRNKVVHVGKQAPEYSKIEEILLSVKDFLWLIDYYCGFTWSLDHIREETLEAIKKS